MRKRPLGRTGLVVSELALGTWGLSGDGYGPVAQGEAERAVARALEIGVTLFDTADAYGAGAMEELLGRLASARDDVVIVTKVGLDRAVTPPRQRFTPEHVKSAVERSRKRLARDRIPVVLLHHPSVDVLYRLELKDALLELKREGKIAHWGVAAGDEDVARAALERGAEVIELPYNLMHALPLHRLAGDLMIEGAGVLARSVLAYGLLAGEWTRDRTFAEDDHRGSRWTREGLSQQLDHIDVLRYLVHDDVRTMRGAAVRFVLANHLVSSAVLGPRSVAQLEQLVRETGAGPRYLPEADYRELPRTLDRVGVRM